MAKRTTAPEWLRLTYSGYWLTGLVIRQGWRHARNVHAYRVAQYGWIAYRYY